jgi:hypothetical protein
VLWERGIERSEWLFVWAFCHPRFVILEWLVIQQGMNIQSELVSQILCQFLKQTLSPSKFLIFVPFSELFGSILDR